MKYIYTNTEAKTIFECEAEDILAADKQYKSHAGLGSKESIPSFVTTWSPDWWKPRNSDEPSTSGQMVKQ
jgi:hypothetical protein